jgi:tripartite-type tricarboxylate transporter receptor subunit TctC
MHRLATLSLTTALLLLLRLALPTGEAAAQIYPSQVYPSRPLTMVVPYPAGGPTDAVARILAEGLRAPLGQPVGIENVTGAGGSIGVRRVARAAADGYTLSIGQLNSHVFGGALYASQYDLLRDFEPVALLTTNPLMFTAKKGLPANDMADPTARARFAQLGQEIFPHERQTPDALRAFQEAEIEKWWPIIKAAGIKPE